MQVELHQCQGALLIGVGIFIILMIVSKVLTKREQRIRYFRVEDLYMQYYDLYRLVNFGIAPAYCLSQMRNCGADSKNYKDIKTYHNWKPAMRTQTELKIHKRKSHATFKTIIDLDAYRTLLLQNSVRSTHTKRRKDQF